jgi:L-alanine-DL-glutamate epimerase-like enolase superfamily enzyme
LGQGDPSGYAERIAGLPAGFPVLKVKLGTGQDLEILEQVVEHDQRPLLLDANQGWQSVDQGLRCIAFLGEDRIMGIEQPFAKENWALHRELGQHTRVPVIGDESLATMADLERAPGFFGGVNIKLMKCGGLDRAWAMVQRARALGLKVMLGSMSETSLGCGAMLALAGAADLVDLDGPWLLRNDPFEGMVVQEGRIKVEGRTGIGVWPRSGVPLNWTQIGA